MGNSSTGHTHGPLLRCAQFLSGTALFSGQYTPGKRRCSAARLAHSLRILLFVTAYTTDTARLWHDSARRADRVLMAGPGELTGPLAAALDPRRFTSNARFESLAYLSDGVRACSPDSVVIALRAPAQEEVAIIEGVASQQPTVIWTDREDLDLVEQAVDLGAASCVVGETRPERINQVLTVARVRFSQQRKLREELAHARQALADRKVIDRAKGILMDRRKLSEDDAYHLMRRIAMNHGKRLAEVANAIVLSPAALQSL